MVIQPKMKVMSKGGTAELAHVYVAMMRGDPNRLVEFVDACDPRLGGRRHKWVIIVSTQFGCPVGCLMCDAGGEFNGNLSAGEIISQVDRVVADNALDPRQCQKFKVQLARMGEPALNDETLSALVHLGKAYPNMIPCVATVAPAGREEWFGELLEVRDRFFDFQLQFSINTTDCAERNRLIPYPTMPMEWIADYGRRFFRRGQRKAVLNFALNGGWPVDAEAVRRWFSPGHFIVKLTPLNPTATASANGLDPITATLQAESVLIATGRGFESCGFDVIYSIGNMGENEIGSNCGQAVRAFVKPAAPEDACLPLAAGV